MDIHKPKPWHGLREFLKEYAIIVVGVLTALGAEQAVEILHRQTEVREAREALRSEVASDMTVALASVEEDRCLAKRLDELAAWARGGPHAKPYTGVHFPNLYSLAWETAKTGAASQMPLAERLAYARFYDMVANQKWSIDGERGEFLKLAGYYDLPELRDPEARQLVQEIAQARVLGRVRTGNSLNLVAAGKSMGVQPNAFLPATRSSLATLCGA